MFSVAHHLLSVIVWEYAQCPETLTAACQALLTNVLALMWLRLAQMSTTTVIPATATSTNKQTNKQKDQGQKYIAYSSASLKDM